MKKKKDKCVVCKELKETTLVFDKGFEEYFPVCEKCKIKFKIMNIS